MNMEDALEEIGSPSKDVINEDRRWKLFAMILREFMLAEGVELDRELEDKP